MSISFNGRAAIAFMALSLTMGWAVSPARADITISAAPSLLEVSATPGGVGSQDITITNAGSEPFAVLAEVAQYKGGEGDLSAVGWLQVEPASFELAPGQRQVVKVTISIPADASSGGRYAMVAFRTGGKSNGEIAVGVAAQVGVPFLITVQGAGDLARQPVVDSLVPVLEPGGGLGFRAVIVNRGNVHLYARGTVDVVESGRKSGSRLALRETTAILPGAEELLYSDRTMPFREGAGYRARAEVSFGGGRPETKEIQFDATAVLAIEEVSPRPSPAGELDVRLRLKNDGGLALLPRVLMAVRGEDGKVVGVLSPNKEPLVRPGQTVEVEARYPGRLARGSYALVARAEFGSSSVQQEAPFEIGGPAARAAGPVPVREWAEGAPIQPREATPVPGDAAPAPRQAAPTVPNIPAPLQETPSATAGTLVSLLPLAALALVGVLASWYVRRWRPVPLRPGLPRALPSPAAIGSGLAEQLRRRPGRRHASHSSPAASLPPPPLHLLPAPVRGDEAMQNTHQPPEEPDTAPPHLPPTASGGELSGALGTARPALEPVFPVDLADRADRSEPRTRVRLAAAVAEKAAALVEEAGRAARRGDQVAVERLSRQALKLDPWNVEAWLWLAASCEDAHSTRLCLKAVLLLDPNNVRAKRGLASLGGELTGDGRPDGYQGEAAGDGRRHDAGAIPHPTS